MEQHLHPEYATHNEVNHFGKRVNEIEVDLGERVAVQESKTGRNEEDITKMFELVGKNAEQLGAVEKSLAGLSGKIAGVVAAVSGLVFAVSKVAEHFIGK